ncbi:MAG: hypothetical protein WCW64_08335, partial [Phycisphaerae bacterium]
NDVNNADNTDTTGIYQGNQLGTTFNFNPHILRPSTVYWRVDEFDGTAVWKGSVWKLVPAFSTPASSYTISSKIVSTTVFVWYPNGQVSGPWLPLDGINNWNGSVAWWKSQIKQMMKANIDLILVHVGYSYDAQRTNLFSAMSELRTEGYDVPKVAPWPCPVAIWATPLDLATVQGKDKFVNDAFINFYNQYFSVNTDVLADHYLAKIDQRLVLDIWYCSSDLLLNLDSLTRSDVETRLSNAFGLKHPIFNNGIYLMAMENNGPSFTDERFSQFQALDYYRQTINANGVTTTHVKPGYWDQNIRTPGNFTPRNGGTFYRDSWNQVLSHPENTHVYVESWNEFYESTGIYAADVNNTPYLIDGRTYSPGSTSDTWSSTNNPFEYIDTTAAGARQFNGIPDYNSAILWNNIPVKMNAGKTYMAYVLVRNTGDLSWTAANNFKLGHTSSGALFGSNRHLIDDNSNEIDFYGGIFRGRPIIFEMTLVAPSKGNYVTHWRMLREYIQWFGQELTLPITVYASGDLNQDNFVNFLDLAELASQWLQSGQSSGNLNADEIVNFEDFAIMAGYWLK